ncbi:DUF2336 domain-containing protein [Microvirga tunisiensis]|uniref:DUF2336 domain-containing protein n=2 Tax=Pannonibacter tanglangensis TaxID=2750084 RepID=A0A7X5J7P9_9HYPH|nr:MULTISPECIES: DUF2336 domain-containing protein [unclassified Pannonibacter]NBN63342.1 DUF2336 domain-containing protein [Pannonibacter sp. XCT-34]NBN76977.1 DUF2336 domain-containing protein [Pannonibacter sp. XCT-53]
MVSLSKLSELALDRSAGGRQSLVEAVTDMFLAAPPEQVDHVSLLFGDIVLKVIGQLEDEARMALAVRISDSPNTPHDLAFHLAKDDFSVAQPMLENSPVLTTSDLVDIASTGSMDHLGAIADRRPLEEEVTSVIVDRGSSSVLAKVAGNEAARFSANAFDLLVEKARAHPQIQEALIGRNDIPEEGARRLVSFLSEELRRRIQEMGGDNTLVNLLAERAAQEVHAQVRDLGSAKNKADMLIRDVKARKRPVDDAVNQFTKGDRPVDLAMLFAELSELPHESVARVVFNPEDTVLNILCRANGVSDVAYKNIVMMRAKRLKLTTKDLNDAFTRYARVQRGDASRALQAIKERMRKAS